MLRVLHVTEAPGWGIFSLLAEFTREQVDRGNDVHVLAPERIRRLPGVRHHDWRVERGRPLTYLRGIRQLRRTLHEVRPDVVHLHSFFGGFFGRLPLLSGLGDVPVVYQPHAWAFNVVELSRVRSVIAGWERLAGRRTDVLVANCAEEVEEGRQEGAAVDGVSLGIALDTTRFAPVDADEQARLRAELGVREAGVLLCLGRWAKQKGQDQLIRAWEADPLPAAELVLVGIEDPAPLEDLAPTEWGRSIRVVPTLTDVRPWLWACDLLVLPSRYEGSAVTVPEALACGRPVVATAVNGVQEELLDGPYPPAGAVVPLGDMAALLREAGRRLRDRPLRDAEGMAGRTRALALFDARVVVDRLDAAYARAIAVRRTRAAARRRRPAGQATEPAA